MGMYLTNYKVLTKDVIYDFIKKYQVQGVAGMPNRIECLMTNLLKTALFTPNFLASYTGGIVRVLA